MPLRGSNHSPRVQDKAPFFDTLTELDDWASKPARRLNGVVDYHPRRPIEGRSAEQHGKLLVISIVLSQHPGGYTETPSGLTYTFNFWSYCDTFVYFSHHRITVPPSGWTNAAHRQGVKMLGTLIFEGQGQEDCLRLLVGRLPQSGTGPAMPSSDIALPLSPHYAHLLADLAHQRGFDGYLLNVECPLIGKIEQTRALSAWISILESELQRKVGSHAQVIWYDSVVVTGDLRWQDRLNTYNLPFFIPSTGFFTNYTWPTSYPSLTAQYFLSLDSSLMLRPKSLRDIFVGVDVWGRGQHGGGGFGSYRALSHIDPQFLGLSAALFGQAWTWETEQDKPGFSWETWWAYERSLWLGAAQEGQHVATPPETRRQGEPECAHGPFKPITSFFRRLPPPNPADYPFLSWFSPGAGGAWFVRGTKVLQTEAGWTDLDKNTSLGDLAWPRPALQWEDGGEPQPLPTASSSLCMDDAWLGGSSLDLLITVPASDAEDAFFRCMWIPVQSLSITSERPYKMTMVFKVQSKTPVDFDIGLSMKLLADDLYGEFEVTPVSEPASEDPLNGWTRLDVEFSLPSDFPIDILAAAGLIVGFAVEDPSQDIDISVRLGLLSVHPSSSTLNLSAHRPKILWVDYHRADNADSGSVAPGTLTWDIAASFAPMSNIVIPSDREDPHPLWQLDHPFPPFVYFNLYALAHAAEGSAARPEDATFIGTTGLTGQASQFYVDPACLPPTIAEASNMRFYVQGVTDRGHVLEWDRCAFVDVRVPPR
ncbi:glycoside hydrolase family 85 protein [Postia placenta MAD-698-R-SB12]|uniref:Glycoside hydrolase family 85 protein n=1 Tax=Postia placenta MAD-698-R-SB12 TaxID=670580 RepID=A0A1X6MWH2_9APHY|nr:glycoside hydrolase family 85 protein [Postia placenta MAD-698-R-SB12]OSX60714.1 glycoside hydrolase family 85 protein [Postia placenta MAD-698-R-SB12]